MLETFSWVVGLSALNRKCNPGTSLVVQWLRPRASTAGARGSSPLFECDQYSQGPHNVNTVHWISTFGVNIEKSGRLVCGRRNNCKYPKS